jgi:protein-tyrosine-phosphatase
VTELRIVTTVCTGNLCRSPLAEALLRKHLGMLGVTDVVVQSAGTAGTAGHRAIGASRRAAEALGADLSQHRTNVLDRAMIDESELVLCAATEHVREIMRRWPDLDRDKVRLIGEVLEDPDLVDIEDPHGFDQAMFHLIARVIDGAMGMWAKTLQPSPWKD